MKKYLMTGMAALAMCAAFTSCSKDKEFELITPEKQSELNYENAFKSKYGEIDPSHSWGFDEFKYKGTGTRGSQPNRNEWGKAGTTYADVVIPADVTTKEAAYVMNWFATHTKADGTTLDLNDYFVQQVGYGGHEYSYSATYYETKENGEWKTRTDVGKVAANNHMDYIYANMDGSGNNWDHFYNFNNNSGDIMLMWGSETKYGFGFNESYGTDKTHVYENYLLAEITVPGNCFDDGVARTGYYVGFDYETLKMETASYGWVTDENGGHPEESFDYEYIHIAPNGVYDDRVVKIVPAKKQEEFPAADVRVLAEDLELNETFNGQKYEGDFDFNDAVFDVIYNYNGTTWIIVQAAGGTYPLYVDGNEVHAALGSSSTNVMIHTDGSKGPSKPINLGKLYTDANDITVTVDLPTGTRTLEAGVGKAPHKLAVSPTFDWMSERVSIEELHPNFSNWVKHSDARWY